MGRCSRRLPCTGWDSHPQIIDLFPEPGTDDDHVLAIFRRGSCLGAIAKSNYAGLRFREAIYRSFRELVLSYFESFYNIYGQKTLRSFTPPLDLRRYDAQGWMWQDETADRIEKRLYGLPRKNLFPPEIAQYFAPVDQRSFEAGRLGTDPDGLYKPLVT